MVFFVIQNIVKSLNIEMNAHHSCVVETKTE